MHMLLLPDSFIEGCLDIDLSVKPLSFISLYRRVRVHSPTIYVKGT